MRCEFDCNVFEAAENKLRRRVPKQAQFLFLLIEPAGGVSYDVEFTGLGWNRLIGSFSTARTLIEPPLKVRVFLPNDD